MAHTIERLRQDTNKIVLGHFVGASPASRNSRGIFDHLAEQLKRNYEIDLGSTSTFSSLQDEFAFLLSKINDRGAVIIVDALDQLDEDSQPLDWLPEYLPENVHILISTTPGPILKRLRQREWDEFAMEPFDREEREAFVVRYLADYGKSLSSDHVSSIAANPKCRNPLFLKMLLEEVRLSAHFTNLDETIDHYLSVKDLDGLFQLMLERLEAHFGRELIEKIFASLAISHTGLRVSELASLTGLHEPTMEHFILTHAHLVIRVGDRYSLFHKALEQAVNLRYLTDQDRQLACASFIIDIVRSTGDSGRTADEAVWLALEYKLHTLLMDLLAIPAVFQHVTDEWDISRPTQLGSKLLKGCDVVGLSNALVDLWKHGVDESTHSKLFIDLSKILITAGHFEQSLDVLGRINLQVLSAIADQVTYYNLLGTSYQELGQNAIALTHLESALQLLRPKQKQKLLVEVLLNIGITQFHERDIQSATNYFHEALKLCEQEDSLKDEELTALSNLGAVHYAVENFREAELYFNRALGAAIKIYGDSDARLIKKLNNLGTVERYLGSFNTATRHVEMSLKLARATYGNNHLDVSQAILNLGSIREAQQQYLLAEQLYRESLAIRCNLLAPEHQLVIHNKNLLQRVISCREDILT
jgi:tetratricopeptide (TPR) repeat protein